MVLMIYVNAFYIMINDRKKDNQMSQSEAKQLKISISLRKQGLQKLSTQKLLDIQNLPPISGIFIKI